MHPTKRPMRRPFLTAEWRNLILVSYAVPPALLERYVPPGLELDTRDGDAFVSVVSFEFRDTLVHGVPWPGYRNFPELNLRFYVRHGRERGVVFVREYVPSRLVAWIARTVYHENYHVARMSSTLYEGPGERTMELRFEVGGRKHRIAATSRQPAMVPGEDTLEHWFKEHQWGFGTDRRGRAVRYEVEHPIWAIHPVDSHVIELDWGVVYGPEWKIMEGKTPVSVVFAEGSAIAVYPMRRVR